MQTEACRQQTQKRFTEQPEERPPPPSRVTAVRPCALCDFGFHAVGLKIAFARDQSGDSFEPAFGGAVQSG